MQWLEWSGRKKISSLFSSDLNEKATYKPTAKAIYRAVAYRAAAYFSLPKQEILWKPYGSRSIFTWDNSVFSVKFRLSLIIIAFILGFFLIGIKLILITTDKYINSKSYPEPFNHNRLDIVDRNGNLLAVNLPTASLYANPQKVIDPAEAVKKLQSIIPDLDNRLLTMLQGNSNFIWVKRDITPKIQTEIHNLGLTGFGFERETKRIYIYGNLLSHVIGYVGRDMNGLAGIEQHFDKLLSSNKGDFTNHYNSNQAGITLTIDVRIQSILDEEINNIIEKFHAKGGAGLVVDPNNGEILAMVSKPDFDPHHPGNATENELFNLATQGIFEMGSGMKAITLAIGLDTEVTTMNDAYDLSYMNVNGFMIKDYHPLKGWHTVPEIFINSSNIGVSQIMLEVGKNNLQHYLKKLGLLDRLQIELPERAYPLFPKHSHWTDLSLVTMSYGYGISESPLHFIQAMIPVVNGGIFYPVTLLKRTSDNPQTGIRVFKESTSIAMRKLMWLTVAKGTGKKADVEGYYVGGKTGTANKAIRGKYDKEKRISSFLGIVPASNPQYIVYIIIDEPHGIKQTFGFAGGGWTAAPAAGAVLKRIITLYGLEKPDKNSKEVQDFTDIQYKIKNEA